jgi:hypothetical protein
MKKYLYNFIDTYEGDDSDLSFIIESTADEETMRSIEVVADLIWQEIEDEDEDEMPSLSPQEKDLYDKYYKRYAGESKALIIGKIVKEEGYTWEEPDMIEIEW